MGGWVRGWVGGCVDGWVGAWMGWVRGWVDGWVGAWVGGCTCAKMHNMISDSLTKTAGSQCNMNIMIYSISIIYMYVTVLL